MQFTMKRNIKVIVSLLLLALLAVTGSCRKESLNPLPVFEPGVTGYGVLKSGSFKASDQANSNVKIDLSWWSAGGAIKIDKIEAYISFYEPYVDANGNDAIADHGKGVGKTAPSLVLTGLANQVPGTLTITPDLVYQLYKDATFKYDGVNEVPVFNNPSKPRPAGSRFMLGDSFRLTWRLYASNGLVYKSWSVSIQNGELKGANTYVDWAMVP